MKKPAVTRMAIRWEPVQLEMVPKVKGPTAEESFQKRPQKPKNSALFSGGEKRPTRALADDWDAPIAIPARFPIMKKNGFEMLIAAPKVTMVQIPKVSMMVRFAPMLS